MGNRGIRFSFRRIDTLVLMVMLLVVALPAVSAQEKQTIQIKTFDQKLQPLKNIEVSLNGREYVQIGTKGSAIIELLADDLPVRSVAIKDDKLEAASWNLSKGVIEIIVRPKSYAIVHFVVRFPDGSPLPNAAIQFKGIRTLNATTNRNGEFDLPLSLEEKASARQFQIQDVVVSRVSLSAAENVITVNRSRAPGNARTEVADKSSIQEELNDFDLSKLDSIQSLTVFYAVFKNISVKDLSEEARLQIEGKFNQLVAQMRDSVSKAEPEFMGNISDSSFVAEDIRSLVNHATLESGTLQTNRAEFQEKIKVIAGKLEKGIVNFTPEERKNLLGDLDLLEQLLIQNESKFYQNQSDYREIINSLRQKYFDIQNLETQLSDAERKREEEQRSFQQRLLGIAAVLLVFAVMIVLLISFSGRLRKQANDLKAANEEIQTINENLEAIVVKRTKLLEESNRELDTFLYRASHDLRSPVSTILGLCNIVDSIPRSEMITRVKGTTGRMDRMLKKLISISEIAQQSSNIITINVRQTINEVKSRYQPQIDESGIQFHVDCADTITLNTSVSIMECILANLIENAVFFCAIKNTEHGRVEIKAVMKGSSLVLSVYDNGVGIEEVIRPKIFDMFFIGNEMSRGNGLGLYSVHKCVHALSAEIAVESQAGRYSEFKVTIPNSGRRLKSWRP